MNIRYLRLSKAAIASFLAIIMTINTQTMGMQKEDQPDSAKSFMFLIDNNIKLFLRIPLNWTWQKVMQEIGKQQDINIEQQMIILNGKRVDKNKKLADEDQKELDKAPQILVYIMRNEGMIANGKDIQQAASNKDKKYKPGDRIIFQDGSATYRYGRIAPEEQQKELVKLLGKQSKHFIEVQVASSDSHKPIYNEVQREDILGKI